MKLLYNQEVKHAIDAAYQSKKSQYESMFSELDRRLQTLEHEDLKDSVKFILAHLPLSDIAEETIFSTILNFAETALYAREKMPWGSEIPTDIFLSDVLFPRVNNEWLEPVRDQFYEMLAPRVKGMTMEEAVIETNYFCFEQATYVGSDIRTAPPSTLLKSGQGRCGEESVFAIMALRSIGIPARQIYVPRWAHCDSNHAWVEVWCGGDWHYLGACEPEEALDRGWFTSAASRAVLVESRAFYHNVNKEDAEEAVKTGLTYLVNRTGHYAASDLMTITISDTAGKPIEGLHIMLELVNSAGLERIGELVTDVRGCASITIGKGTVHLHVTDGRNYMEKWIHTAASEQVELTFSPVQPEERRMDYDIIAPVITGVTNPPLDSETLIRQKAKTEAAVNIRKSKEADYFSVESGRVREENTQFLVKARGNHSEISGFLTENPGRYAALLLTTLYDKDFSDCKKEILSAHLHHATVYAETWEEDIFVNYVLAPRIYFEHMSDYRSFLAGAFSERQKQQFAAEPARLWEYIETNISYVEEEGCANILATPAAVLRSGYGSPLSRKILFVAILRSLGVPARLTKETLQLEYFDGTAFVRVTGSEQKDSGLTIHFAPESNWIYGFNWSVSMLRDGVFLPLDFAGETVEHDRLYLRLTHGCYRVFTSNRLPSGNVYFRLYEVVLEADKEKELSICLRSISEEDMVSRAKINDFPICRLDRSAGYLSDVMKQGKNILLWLTEDQEPTQHILNEMMAQRDHFRHKESVVFILGSDKAAENRLISEAASALAAGIVVDEEFLNAEPSARLTFVDPEKLPLVIISDEQFSTCYAVSGYNVGTADMLLKILDMVGK